MDDCTSVKVTQVDPVTQLQNEVRWLQQCVDALADYLGVYPKAQPQVKYVKRGG